MKPHSCCISLAVLQSRRLMLMQVDDATFILGRLDDTGASWSTLPDTHTFSAIDACHTSLTFQRESTDGSARLSANRCPMVCWRVRTSPEFVKNGASHCGNVHYYVVSLLAKPQSDGAFEGNVQIMGALLASSLRAIIHNWPPPAVTQRVMLHKPESTAQASQLVIHQHDLQDA